MTENHHHLLFFRLIPVFVLAAICSANDQTISLSDVYERIEQDNPNLKAFRSALKAAESEVRQAHLLPNPEAEIELEDFGRNVTGVALSQAIPFGGARGAGTRLAHAKGKAAEIELESARLQLRAEAMRRFGSALAVKQKRFLVDSLVVLAGNTMDSIERRVEAGATMALDLVRAKTALQELVLERAGLEREYLQARRELSMLWDDAGEPNWEPAGVLVCSPFHLSTDEITLAVDNHPDIRLLENDVSIAEEEGALARAERLPALDIGVGVVLDNELDEYASLLRASVSLPLFNRNQGTIARMGHKQDEAEHIKNSERIARRTEVTRVVTEITTLTERIATTRNTILPNTEQILSTLMQYYKQGAVGILEVLEAQQAMLETWLEHTDNLRERTALAADLLELTGIECEVLQ